MGFEHEAIKTNAQYLLSCEVDARYSTMYLPRHNIYAQKELWILTHEEYLSAMRDMSKEERAKWEIDTDKYVDDQKNLLPKTPTKESPYYIHLTGTDDVTYGLCVETEKAALEIVDGIRLTQTWSMLKEYGFVCSYL